MIKTNKEFIIDEDLVNTYRYLISDNEIEKLEALLQSGSNPNAIASDDYSGLYYAIDSANVEAVRLLIAHGARADQVLKSPFGTTPLIHLAVSSDGTPSPEIIDMILAQKGTDINARNNDEKTPLLIALQFSQSDIALYLIEKGADCNATDKSGGNAFLYAALCSEKCATIFDVLTEKSTLDFKAAPFDGETPLHYAAYYGNIEYIEVLMNNGADLMARNDEGDTPLQVAIKESEEEAVELIEAHMSDEDKAIILCELSAAQDDGNGDDDNTADQNATDYPDFIQDSIRDSIKAMCSYANYTVVQHLSEKGAKTYTIYKDGDIVDVKKDALKAINNLAGLGISEEEKMNTNAWGKLVMQGLQKLETQKGQPKSAGQQAKELTSKEYDGESKVDEFGVTFSADGTKLIKAPNDIESYTVPEGTEVICDEAFYECGGLESIQFPSSLTHIGMCAFKFCYPLQNITIPASVVYIGGGAFSGIEDDEQEIQIEGDNFHFIDSVLYSKDKTTMICAMRAYGVEIPDFVTHIAEYAYSGIVPEEPDYAVIIPNSVTHVGDYAFYNCDELQGVVLPEFLTYLGKYAFANCTALKRVVIPEKIKCIEDGAFSNCEDLQRVVLPDTLIGIEAEAFSGCGSLRTVIFTESIEWIGDSAFDGCSDLDIGSVELPNLEDLGENAFHGCENVEEFMENNDFDFVTEW